MIKILVEDVFSLQSDLGRPWENTSIQILG